MTDVTPRDELHRHSIMSSVVAGVICGMGAAGYELAVSAVAALLES